MGCRLSGSRLPPSRLQLRGALWVLIGTVLSVALLLAIIGWGAAEGIATSPGGWGSRLWLGAPVRSWCALMALMAARLPRQCGFLVFTRSRGDTKSNAIACCAVGDTGVIGDNDKVGKGKIKVESNQALSALIASLRHMANAVMGSLVGVVAHRFGAVVAPAAAVPPSLLLVLLLAPRHWHTEMDAHWEGALARCCALLGTASAVAETPAERCHRCSPRNTTGAIPRLLQ